MVNLFSDRRIIKLPLQPLLSRIIARTRAKKVAARYEAIGGGSPILSLTREQADKTIDLLKQSGYDCAGYVGMNYWHPFIDEAVRAAVDDGFDQVLGLSLFPHYSRATSGACLGDLKEATDRLYHPIVVDTVESWYDDPLYISALAETVKAGLDRFDDREKSELKIIFSAHSLPKDFVDQGDPYPEHVRATVAGVLKATGPLDWVLTYQSRSGPVEWLEPQTDVVINELADAGVKNLLVVPVSFVSDHIETLYELDIMYKEQALSRGVAKFERAPALNGRPDFIKALAGIVKEAVS